MLSGAFLEPAGILSFQPASGGATPWSPIYPAGRLFHADPNVDSYNSYPATPCDLTHTACNQLNDETAGAHHLGASGIGAAPTWTPNAINGKSVLAFNGTTTGIGNVGWNPAGLSSIAGFIVAKWLATGGVHVLFGWQNAAAGDSDFIFYQNTTLQFTAKGVSDTTATVVSTHAVDTTSYHVYSWSYDSASGKINTWVDDTPDVVNQPGPTGVLATPINGLQMGIYNNGNFANALVGESMIYSPLPNAAGLQAIRTKLRADYGI